MPTAFLPPDLPQRASYFTVLFSSLSSNAQDVALETGTPSVVQFLASANLSCMSLMPTVRFDQV